MLVSICYIPSICYMVDICTVVFLIMQKTFFMYSGLPRKCNFSLSGTLSLIKILYDIIELNSSLL